MIEWKPQHLDCYEVSPMETGRASAVTPFGGYYQNITSGGARDEGGLIPLYDSEAEAWSRFAAVFSNCAEGARVALFRSAPSLRDIEGRFCVSCRVAFR